MGIFQEITEYLKKFSLYGTTMDFGDVVEILIIAVLLYYILVWIKKTRAWTLMKGMLVILLFLVVAYFANMDTILWIAQNIFSFAVFALIVVLQPELRKALEELGTKRLWRRFFLFDAEKTDEDAITMHTINEIVHACLEMGRVRTGALIVIEQQESLSEFEKTGIDIDAVVSNQLLINIFEHNTPLHDGAVIIRGNRIVSATCYLPLTKDLSLSKELGTRHRAGLGITEETDGLVIIVSEETGRISMAHKGELFHNLDSERLKEHMKQILMQDEEETGKSIKIFKGRSREKK